MWDLVGIPEDRFSQNEAQIRGYNFKITNISAANCPKVANLVPNKCLDTGLYMMARYINHLIIIFLNVNGNFRK